MTNKHFKAVHKQTGETIEFGLEDIMSRFWLEAHFEDDMQFSMGLVQPGGSAVKFENASQNKAYLSDWLKDYDLFYQHQGEYYVYENKSN